MGFGGAQGRRPIFYLRRLIREGKSTQIYRELRVILSEYALYLRYQKPEDML
jgi:hypothetical protein